MVLLLAGSRELVDESELCERECDSDRRPAVREDEIAHLQGAEIVRGRWLRA